MAKVWVCEIVFCLLLSVAVASSHENTIKADVIVWRATPSGVSAAISAARVLPSGLVVLAEETAHVGGMMSGGLAKSDKGDTSVIGGIALDFFTRIGRVYSSESPVWDFEPHVAEKTLRAMLQEQTRIKVLTNWTLKAVQHDGGLITSLVPSSAALPVLSAPVFVDASYEGDLVRMADVAFTWGREGSSQYGESLAGRQAEPSAHGYHQFEWAVDPFDATGQPLPLIYRGDPGSAGEADRKVQSYNYRLCLTTRADLQVPFTREPAHYNSSRWELFRRYLAHPSAANFTVGDVLGMGSTQQGKFDGNNKGPISTDFLPDSSWNYPLATREKQQQIAADTLEYTQGFLYFLATDAAVPSRLQADVKRFGLCGDEFKDTAHWPFQLYVRESVRMVGEYVVVQNDTTTSPKKTDTIGLGSYQKDSHHAQRFVHRFPSGEWGVLNEGDVEVPSTRFEIPLRALRPLEEQCSNLVVAVAVSASHIGYAALRLEPQYMIMGQAAGVCAALSAGGPVQQVPTAQVQKVLLQQGQKLFR